MATFDVFSGHIINIIAETSNSKKRYDNKSATAFIQKNHSTNADLKVSLHIYNFCYDSTIIPIIAIL